MVSLPVKGGALSENIDTLRKVADRGVITHASRFHADDILSAALLILAGIIPNSTVIKRVGQVPKDFDGLVFDIGGGRFDHHQEQARVRPSGVPYAAFGLLWDAIGTEYVKNKYETDEETAMDVAKHFDEVFISSMDLTDNIGQKKAPNTLSYLLSSMNNEQDIPQDDLFKSLVNTFCKYLANIIESSYKVITDRKQAAALAVADFITLPLECKIDRSAFENTRVKYVIKESHRGTWNITVIDPYKIPSEYINMPGCVQVYKIGAAFDTYEHALMAAVKLTQ